MMRNKDKYAIAVRKSDGSIVLKEDTYKGILADSVLKKIPFIRGIFVFIDSMILGLGCTNYSAEIYAEDDPDALPADAEKNEENPKTHPANAEKNEENPDALPADTGKDSENDDSAASIKNADKADSPAPENDPGETSEKNSDNTDSEVKNSEEKKPEKENSAEKNSDEQKESFGEQALTAVVMILSFALAIGLFMVLPYFLASHVVKLTGSTALLSLFEGIIRIAIFVCYILAISQMKDIRRLFQYHGAEHKCINCLEGGNELTVENAKKATRLHKRCGSSFILFVMMVSIVLFFFIRVRNPIARVGLRILLLPVISGISYELIRFAGSSDNPVIALLSKPGLMLQGLTTKEPDDRMLEVAIASVEAVFDWRDYLEREFPGGRRETADCIAE